MYCPSCRTQNEPDAGRCSGCRADLSGLRDRVSVGAQFVMADASARQPVALALDGQEPHAFTEPTIVSRHLHSVDLGESAPSAGIRRRRPAAPPATLPRLPAPQGPDLAAVITERRIYRPKDEAHFFVVIPGAGGQEVEMEVQLAGQQITRQKVTLDEAGLALRPFSDLEEGEYTVLVRRDDQSGTYRRPPAQCTFSVAEFSLSPLIALLEEHTFVKDQLRFRMRVMLLSAPYSGGAELGLQCRVCGDRVVATQRVQVRDGRVEAAFDIGGHGGPFHAQITTPGGETASVFFPGTEATERDRVTLCPLGRVAEAGLLPGEDTREVRGLHVGYRGAQATPVRLESAVAGTGRLIVDGPAAAMQVVTFHPLTGAASVYDRRDLKGGDTVEFPVEPPYTLFTVGVQLPRRAYEAWGVVVRPLDLEGRLLAPATAAPGAEIAVHVESSRPAACLLLVYDARLEHESPVPKLAKRMVEAMRGSTSGLREAAILPLSAEPEPEPEAWGALREANTLDRPSFLRATATRAVAAAPPGTLFQMGHPAPASVAGAPGIATQAEPLTLVVAPSREDFPELAYLELLKVQGAAERSVPLGDQIGTWRCRAYLVAGLDLQELTADVEAAKAVYAELDLPAIVGQGDDIVAGVRYHTQKPATMTITLPGGATVSGAVIGHGAEMFHLTEPGEVTVHISSIEGDDWTTRRVEPPGIQSVTASRLEVLRRGETASGERVVVYPGPGSILAETIEALGRYPFG